jgi:hypothetical protein
MRQYTAHGRDALVSVSSPDPPEHLVKRVGVGEDVVRRLPIGVLIGIAEARYPKRRRVGERSAKVNRSGAGADRRLKPVDDPDWVITEQLSRERRVLRPAACAAAGCRLFARAHARS